MEVIENIIGNTIYYSDLYLGEYGIWTIGVVGWAIIQTIIKAKSWEGLGIGS